MKIWVVDCEDLSCAWSSFEKAETFLMGESKRCNWEFCNISDRYENEWAVYDFLYENKFFSVSITSYILDEKPYI